MTNNTAFPSTWRQRALSIATQVTVVGLLVAAVGILIQFFALPEDFPTIPPGPVILVATAAVVAFGSRLWWSPSVGVAVGLLILVGNIANGGLGDNITDSMPPAIGVVVMEIGLVTAIVAGAVATTRNRRGRTNGTAVTV